jgi:hypothetical protein
MNRSAAAEIRMTGLFDSMLWHPPDNKALRDKEVTHNSEILWRHRHDFMPKE